MKPIRFLGINFDHMHMGDLLRMVYEAPKGQAEVVGICDESRERMSYVIDTWKVPAERVFTDYKAAIEKTKPDVIILCPSTAQHEEWVLKVAPYHTHILLEKPFAATLAQADRMISAMNKTGKLFAINWPLRWYPPHVTSKRLLDEGRVGRLLEVHYYDGNRGPYLHGADKKQTSANDLSKLWWYQKAKGGGSLQDYLGYGVTLGTWFHDGKLPLEITSVVDQTPGLEVDLHSITIARYDTGLSKYETRWGTFSDPWTHQPQPKCGFVLVGEEGTIASYDYEETIRLQTHDQPQGLVMPVDKLKAPHQNPIQYLIHCIRSGEKISGPLAPDICRIGQQIIETAMKSIEQKKTVPLVK